MSTTLTDGSVALATLISNDIITKSAESRNLRPHPKQSGYTRTKAVIYKMMTSNTGASILDSGDTCGRAWEINRTNKFDRFPNVYQRIRDEPSKGYLINTFKFLCSNLHYNHTLHTEFMQYCRKIDVDDSMLWPALMESYAEEIGEHTPTMNTFEDEYCLLDSTLQFIQMNDRVLVQYHGGCDVRGGYTAPIAFECKEGTLFYTDAVWLQCECNLLGFYENSWCDYNGDVVEFPKNWISNDGRVKCTSCRCPVVGNF